MGPQDDGLYFPQAGIVEPETYLAALLSDTPVIREQVQKFTRADDQWQVTTKTGEHQFDAVLVANAQAAHRFCQLRGLPITASHGQIDYFPHGADPQHRCAAHGRREQPRKEPVPAHRHIAAEDARNPTPRDLGLRKNVGCGAAL